MIPDKKEIQVTYLLMRNPYMKFQNLSFKIFLNGRTPARADARMHRQAETNMAPFLLCWGNKTWELREC